MGKVFLSAEWRKLAIANYAIDSGILKKYLPYKTEFDLWNNTCYLSLVGFVFMNTRLKGISIPFHRNFQEINLRFYVRYKSDAGWKRGVVFIKEFVPKAALTLIANGIYKENYKTIPIHHKWSADTNSLTLEYKWKRKNWNSFLIKSGNIPLGMKDGSEEEFITEHYWGYTKYKENQTSEYGVEHRKWQVYKTLDYSINADFGLTYGKEFSFLTNENRHLYFLLRAQKLG